METTIVVFRVDRQGIVFALLPELPADNHGGYCTCYEHVGQHSSADYFACVASSRPATPTEYADLANELEQRGYGLDIRERVSHAVHDQRRMAARYCLA